MQYHRCVHAIAGNSKKKIEIWKLVRDIQTRENNGETTSAQRDCFCLLFLSVRK